MDTTPLACWNGRLLPQTEIHLPLHDAGFVWGATVTDLCRTVRHRLYRWDDHIDRFRRSCRSTGIFPPLAQDELNRLAGELVAHNTKLLAPWQDLALVLLATPGPIGYYAGEDRGVGDAEPTFVMHTFPLPVARYRPLFEHGAHLAIPGTRHVPSACLDPRIKQRSRLHWWLAEQEARRIDPQASALLLDLDGHVTETAAANFLLVRKGKVLSPSRGTVLEGVSLQVVRGLCQKLGVAYRERALTVYDCLNADEAMITSTPICLAGVSQINRTPLPWPGAVFRRLLEAWSEEIGLDIQKQVEGTGG
jgi:branched-chain amino acid aminotransferase